MTHPLSAELRSTADAYAEKALYASEWRHPLDLLRRAAAALDLSEVDRNCLRAALRAGEETRTATAPSLPGEPS